MAPCLFLTKSSTPPGDQRNYEGTAMAGIEQKAVSGIRSIRLTIA